MEPSGIIFAGLDCDADAIEAWNRWYDLEHLPPNVALEGVMLGRRYVAPPELHAARLTGARSAFGDGRGTFLTVYTLTGDPRAAFDDMVGLRERLVAADRMTFPDDKKAVREGDVLALEWAVGAPELKADRADVPFLGHTALVVVQRQGGDAVRAWYREERAAKLVGVEGVHGVCGFSSLQRPGLDLDLVYVEAGDLTGGGAVDPVLVADAARRMRDAAPHHPEAEVVLDAPFLLIDPLRYPWAGPIRASGLPATVG